MNQWIFRWCSRDVYIRCERNCLQNSDGSTYDLYLFKRATFHFYRAHFAFPRYLLNCFRNSIELCACHFYSVSLSNFLTRQILYLHRSAFKFKPMFLNFYLNWYILEYWHDNLIYIIRHKCSWIFDIFHGWIPENRS